jgi:tetratricopeptide (TPR) repeat protein
VTRAWRAALLIVGIVLAGLAAWRIFATGVADRLASDAPEQSLQLESHNLAALRALAQRHLQDGDAEGAVAIAREMLREEAVNGTAFVILAKAAEASGDSAKAEALYRVAVRRAPRDVHVRAWLIGNLISQARYPEALGQFDTLYRLSPGQAQKLLPVFAQLAEAPDFEQALIVAVGSSTTWKTLMYSALLDRGNHDVVDRSFGDLLRQGNLSDAETGRWLDWLMQKGFWDEAYARWVGWLKLPPGAPVPLLFNGGFEAEPSGIGFDWRIRPTAGVTIERQAKPGATGSVALSVSFSGRRVPEINLEQRLLLSQGTYLVSFRARAEGLHSDKGLQWAIQCMAASEPLAVSPALDGSFEWKRFEATFSVPEQDCASQRIWLRNPGAAAAGKEVVGDLWLDDFAIVRAAGAR